MNNPNNQLITKEEVEGILNYFGNIGNNGERLLIKNLDFYQRAFVNESYHQAVQNYVINPDHHSNEPIYLNYISKTSNETLEFLGDHILKTCLGRYLYERFPNEREGFLTRLKIKIEKCSMLHKFAVTLGFKKYLLLSLQIENQTILGQDRGRGTPSIYEDAFEAFLGSIMEDFGEYGYLYADRFLRNIIENTIDFAELISKNDNFKDSLQRFFQSLKWKTPTYVNVIQEGPLYRKIFTRLLYISNEQLEQLSKTQQYSIKKYTTDSLIYYQTSHPTVYIELVSKVNNGNFILCIGQAKKVVSSEQIAAKQGLINLNLDLDY
jgi:dsRNA-specific ribonuclease